MSQRQMNCLCTLFRGLIVLAGIVGAFWFSGS